MAKTQSQAEGTSSPSLTIGMRGELLRASPELGLAVEPIQETVLDSLLRFVRSVAVSPGVISVLQLVAQLSAVRPDGARVSWVSPAPICAVLGITQQGASKILKRLCALGVLREDGDLLEFTWTTTAGARPRSRRLFVVTVPELPIGSQFQLEVETPTPCLFVPVSASVTASSELDNEPLQSPQRPTQPTPKRTPKKAIKRVLPLEESQTSQSSLEIVDEKSNPTKGHSPFCGTAYNFREYADLAWLFEPHREVVDALNKSVAGLMAMCSRKGFRLADVVLVASRNPKCESLQGMGLLSYICGMIGKNSPSNHFGMQATRLRAEEARMLALAQREEADAAALTKAANLQGVILENAAGETAVIEGRFISFTGGSVPLNAKTFRLLETGGFVPRSVNRTAVTTISTNATNDQPRRGIPPDVLTLMHSRRAALRAQRDGRI